MISSTRRAVVLLVATFVLGAAVGAAGMAYASRTARARRRGARRGTSIASRVARPHAGAAGQREGRSRPLYPGDGLAHERDPSPARHRARRDAHGDHPLSRPEAAEGVRSDAAEARPGTEGWRHRMAGSRLWALLLLVPRAARGTAADGTGRDARHRAGGDAAGGDRAGEPGAARRWCTAQAGITQRRGPEEGDGRRTGCRTSTRTSGAGYFYSEGTPRRPQYRPDHRRQPGIGDDQPRPQHELGRLHRLPALATTARRPRPALTAAEAGFANASYQQRFNTTIQFFTALAGRGRSSTVREQSVKRAEEQLKAAVVRLHAGTATRSDSLRSVVTLGNTRVALSQAQADLVGGRGGAGPADRRTHGRVRAADDSVVLPPHCRVDTTALLQEAHEPLAAGAEHGAPRWPRHRRSSRRSSPPTGPSSRWAASWTYNGNNQNNFGLQNQRQVEPDPQLGDLQPVRARAERRPAGEQPRRSRRPTPPMPSTRCESLMLGQFAQVDATRAADGDLPAEPRGLARRTSASSPSGTGLGSPRSSTSWCRRRA